MSAAIRPIAGTQAGDGSRTETGMHRAMTADTSPFAAFRAETRILPPLRAALSAATRRPEPDCLPPLIAAARLPDDALARARDTARTLVTALRDKRHGGGVDALVQEYSLSSDEGVALMCLAEALLRIPDTATRDALIRDKIGGGDWRAHLGHSPSVFVNAATWGLVVTGRLAATASETSLSGALLRMVAKGGEPLIRQGVHLAMRLMGEQFVMGETIAVALARARPMEAKGFRYSYDMLGEAAATAGDAARYFAAYEAALEAIGAASAGRGVMAGPGLSIKLSALHPRYTRAQRGRVMAELAPRVLALARRARALGVGINIDAEESERLDLSLDILEVLCADPALAGWDGLGFVVQAYQKRAPFVLDVLIDLARRSGHRLMVRLVKGAYWDSEIKRAQMEGLDGFPVYTRKAHTDVAYLACARKLLGAPDAVFPQFATHNALTLATVHEMAAAAGPWHAGQYEFQCLHGMGEALYEEVVGPERLDRPCRIYAPVGTHETLLAYLVRRLLENGANSSFVNKIADPAVPVEALLVDPVAETIARGGGTPHPAIALPEALFTDRRNSAGLDLANEIVLARLAADLADAAPVAAVPLVAGFPAPGAARRVTNPADRDDTVGTVIAADADTVDAALAIAAASAASWVGVPPVDRAALLERAADLFEANRSALMGLAVREAGKTFANAVGEVREAVDFLRYYAAEARGLDPEAHRPLGPVAAISPWNFPLAIFTGEVAAALAAGNPVLAKPAEETPLIAHEAVRLLHAAGVPEAALQFLPGEGDVGARLVADPRVKGVLFTGSTEVARLISTALAARCEAAPIPLVAETGGQNAMLVDSSALPEQVVADVIASAFDSAGQRCSALRILCLQEEVADRILAMLKGALAELKVGPPDRLATDIGPAISAEAAALIERHVEAMRARGFAVHRAALPPETAAGSFVAPTLIEIDGVPALGREVFGPVLHVVRFRRQDRDRLLAQIAATGYALTFGLHTRIDETVDEVTARAPAGNIYVNRNIIGAVVGVQPFGGHGLSGTGPKAGGPLYLHRLMAETAGPPLPAGRPDPAALTFAGGLAAHGDAAAAEACRELALRAPAGVETTLPGPVGEMNSHLLEPRGTVLCIAESGLGLAVQIGTALASGNGARIDPAAPGFAALSGWLTALPASLVGRITVAGWDKAALDAALVEGDAAVVARVTQALAARPGPIVPVFALSPSALAGGARYPLWGMMRERTLTINTTAAGGNASLMAIG